MCIPPVQPASRPLPSSETVGDETRGAREAQVGPPAGSTALWRVGASRPPNRKPWNCGKLAAAVRIARGELWRAGERRSCRRNAAGRRTLGGCLRGNLRSVCLQALKRTSGSLKRNLYTHARTGTRGSRSGSVPRGSSPAYCMSLLPLFAASWVYCVDGIGR